MIEEFYIYIQMLVQRGNPGQAAIAVLIFGGGKLLKEYGEHIGKATNNKAEYMAIIKGWKWQKISVSEK